MIAPQGTAVLTVNADTVAEWAATGESEQLEFKATTGQAGEAVKALCGMLNGRGGHVLFGVTPDGQVVGQHVSDKTSADLAGVFKHLKPEVQPHVDRVPADDDRALLVVSVPAGRFRPYLYRGTAYRRVGATTQEMTLEEQQRLFLEQVHSDDRWENQKSQLSLEDLDISLLLETVAEGTRRRRLPHPRTDDPKQLLLRLGLLNDGIPTKAAAVLFGQPEQLDLNYPQCLVRLGRFDGLDKTAHFLDERQVHHNAFGLIEEAEGFLHRHLSIRAERHKNEMIRRDIPEIPVLALREALANAVAHREYHHASGSITVAVFDDRVEIASIGRLHFGLSAEQLYEPHEAQPWNLRLAQMLYRAGIVESFGSGILLMVRLCREAGLPIPVIEDTGQSVRVTFTRPGHASPLLAGYQLSASQLRIIEAIAAGSRARSQLVATTRLTERMVRRILTQLQNEGLAAYTGQGTMTQWHLTGDAERAYPQQLSAE